MYQGHEQLMQAQAVVAHIQEVLWVFLMSGEVVGPLMIIEILNCDLGLTAPDLVEQNCYLGVLGHLMSSWKGCPVDITNVSSGLLVTLKCIVWKRLVHCSIARLSLTTLAMCLLYPAVFLLDFLHVPILTDSEYSMKLPPA